MDLDRHLDLHLYVVHLCRATPWRSTGWLLTYHSKFSDEGSSGGSGPPGRCACGLPPWRSLWPVRARLGFGAPFRVSARGWSVANREAQHSHQPQPETAVRGRWPVRTYSRHHPPPQTLSLVRVSVLRGCSVRGAPFTAPSSWVLLYATRLAQLCSAPPSSRTTTREQRQANPVG